MDAETIRLEAFSDGVFTIAATLLILELRLDGHGSVTHQLVHLWPSYAAYAISFMTSAWLAVGLYAGLAAFYLLESSIFGRNSTV